MAINPNIALGVQPIQQQPNMLAQYAQIMAIKAAQQEMEGNEGIRGALSQGVPDDPTKLLQYGKQGRATYESLLKGKKEQIDSAAKTLTMAGQIAGYVRDNPTPENFVSAVGTMVQSGVLTRAQAERVIADAGNDPTKIKSYAERTVSDALTEADRLTARTRIQAANIGAGPGYQQAQLAREKFNYDKANPQLQMAQGENGFYLFNPRDPNSAVPLGMRPTAPPPPVAQPSAVNNMLITPGVAQPSVNALTQPSPNQAGPTVAAANALANQPTIIRPKQPIRQPVAVIKDGEVILVSPEQAVGMTPATPGAEKILEKTNIAKEGKESVNRVLSNLYSEYGNLVKSGGITDTRRSVEENISARTGASAVGQLTGSFTGSEAQSFRDSIEQTRPLLLTAIMKATGLSATQLNSNVELQTYLKTATDPKVSIQSNVKALNNISQMFGIGEKFEVPDIPKAESKAAKPADAPPPGLSPEISGLWKYMTPEDRKLWQK